MSIAIISTHLKAGGQCPECYEGAMYYFPREGSNRIPSGEQHCAACGICVIKCKNCGEYNTIGVDESNESKLYSDCSHCEALTCNHCGGLVEFSVCDNCGMEVEYIEG